MAETDTGFIVLFRAFSDWEWYDDALTVKLFIHLILNVNWVDKNWRGHEVKRGSMITSYGGLADATNMTVMKLRKRLKDLESTGEIIIKTTNKYSLVTVVKYDEYQDKDSKRTNKEQGKNKLITKKEQQLNKGNKETKKQKKVFVPPRLDEFLIHARKRCLDDKVYWDNKHILTAKYNTYSDNDWHDGNQKPIVGWRGTLGNFIIREILKTKR